MKYRVLLLAAASMLIFSTAAAQNDCGNGLPCGSIPWPQPNPPQLSSPTPIPTATPRPDTSGSVGPGTPTPTPIGANLGSADVANQIATVSGYNPTPVNVLSENGTSLIFADQLDFLRHDTTQVIGYARGLTNLNFGKVTPLVMFMFAALALVVFVKGWTLLMPVFATLIGLFRKIVSFIMEFIPF